MDECHAEFFVAARYFVENSGHTVTVAIEPIFGSDDERDVPGR